MIRLFLIAALSTILIICQDVDEELIPMGEELSGEQLWGDLAEDSSPHCTYPGKMAKEKRISMKKKVKSPGECLKLCAMKKQCQYFNYSKKKKVCSMYTVATVKTKGMLSGVMNCKKTCPPTPPPPPPVGDCKCGLAKRQTKIIGGVETEVNEYPWQVGLFFEQPDTPTVPFCGGSLISDQWVLTAGHCIILKGNDMSFYVRVMLGEHNWIDPDDSKVLYSKLAQRATVLPGYYQLYNDYALLKLETPVDFIKYPHIRPICLPTNPMEDYANFTAIASGWGTIDKYNGTLSTVLKELEVKVLSNVDCAQKVGHALYPSHMCAGGEEAGQSTCAGDSGGPLITSGDGDGVTPGQNYELIGLTSGGSTNCSLPLPVFYSRVTNVLDWIQSTTNGLNTCPRD